MNKNQWVIQQLEDHSYLVSRVQRKRGVWFCDPPERLEEFPQDISGEVYFTISSTKGVVLVEEFPKINTELLEMQINKRLDQLAMLEIGSRGAICRRQLEDRGVKQLLSVVVLPEKEVEATLDTVLENRQLRLSTCTSSFSAVAAFMKNISSEAFVVLLLQDRHAAVIGVRDGVPLYQQSLQVAPFEELDQGILTHAVNFCRQALSRDFGIDQTRLVALGKERERITDEMAGEELFVPEDQSGLVSENFSLLHYPDAYGALFVAQEFSYLPVEYNQSRKIVRASKYIAVTAAVATLVLGGLTWQKSRDNTEMARIIDTENQKLSTSIRRIEEQLPGTNRVKQQEQYLRILAKSEKEPRLHELLLVLADRLPDQVSIDDFQLEKRVIADGSNLQAELPGPETIIPVVTSVPGVTDIAGSGEALITGPETELDKTAVVILGLRSPGDYEMVQARFEKTVKSLAGSFLVEAIEWSYKEDTEEGILQCELHFSKTEML